MGDVEWNIDRAGRTMGDADALWLRRNLPDHPNLYAVLHPSGQRSGLSTQLASGRWWCVGLDFLAGTAAARNLLNFEAEISPHLAIGEALLKDWQAAGLAKPSMLKPLIATLEQRQIIRVMGQFSAVDRECLDKVIQTVLGNI